MAKVITDDKHYKDIADEIRSLSGDYSKTYTPDKMPLGIVDVLRQGRIEGYQDCINEGIEYNRGYEEGHSEGYSKGHGVGYNEGVQAVEIPDEVLIISGNCSYRFAHGGWDRFVEHYGDKITTRDISNVGSMFKESTLKTIPFELNFAPSVQAILTNVFDGCKELTEIPKINNCAPSSFSYFMGACRSVRYLPEDIDEWFDWSFPITTHSGMFNGCYSLRSVPVKLYTHAKPENGYSSSYFRSGFEYCHSLDELIDLPIPYTATWTSNAFYNTFIRCTRLKNLTFALQNGQPYVMNWKNQSIDLTQYVGYSLASTTINITSYNSGITSGKRVTSATTYQALKDDPDWYTVLEDYSRYNHDSAVRTINSLPDTSAYLATAGGTNTIRFKGASGSLTDGGAINTLTEAEIAVATAKGWTVTLA